MAAFEQQPLFCVPRVAVIHRFDCNQIIKINFKLTVKLFVVRRQADGQDVVLKVDPMVQLDQGDVKA
jgi:hypothetical protein